MAPRRNRRRAARRARPASAGSGSTDDPAIDARYGLEPPIGTDGPADATAGVGLEAAELDCPYCGERFETLVDLSAGSSAYIEDCQVCCQPIELTVEVDERGALSAITAVRGD
jgi:hypothetical protein